MIQTVVKRDGRIVGFNKEKIAAAIRKAMLTTEQGEDEKLINQIADRIEFRGKEQSSVEEIQDLVEMELMKSTRKEVAKRYISYRNRRSIARKAKTREIFLEIVEAKSNDVTRENANMNADTPAGMMMKFAERDDQTVCGRLSAVGTDAVGGEQQLSAYPRQGLLSDEVAHLHPASARQDSRTRILGGTRRVAPDQAYRDGEHHRLYLDGDGAERDARADRRFRRSISISRHTSARVISRR